MLLVFAKMTVGVCLLFAGAEGLVRGSVALALRAGLTRLVAGLTIVALGTSSPELVVSVKASLAGSGAIALGNIIGSNICNIALILGLSALVRPVSVDAQVVRLQIPFMIAVSCVLSLLLIGGRLGRLEGLGLLAGIIAYTVYCILLARKESRETGERELAAALPTVTKNPFVEATLVIAGLVLLVIGANLFVSGAVSMAGHFGISQAVIGLTIVAVGTSLPELATSLVAALRNEGDIAVGNIVGSNIFNILAILGIAALIRPIQAGGITSFDILAMIFISLLALPMARSGFVLSRKEGSFLVAIYVIYILFQIKNMGG